MGASFSCFVRKILLFQGLLNSRFCGDTLLGAEDSVTAVAETGADIALVVELTVQVADKNLDVGMDGVELLQAFGSCDDAQEINVFAWEAGTIPPPFPSNRVFSKNADRQRRLYS